MPVSPERSGELLAAKDAPDVFVAGWDVGVGAGCALCQEVVRRQLAQRFGVCFYEGNVCAASREFGEVEQMIFFQL